MLNAIESERFSFGLSSAASQFINVHSRNTDTALLSNFGYTPFSMDGLMFQNIEGFVHYIKIDPDNVPLAVDGMREKLPDASGSYAKILGDKINKAYGSKDHVDGRRVFWQGKSYTYGSDEHHQLIKRAITRKFEQNPNAKQQLLSFPDIQFTHNTGKRESETTSLPARVFTRILTDLRDQFLAEGAS